MRPENLEARDSDSPPMVKSEHRPRSSSTTKFRAALARLRAAQGVLLFMASRVVLIGCGFATYGIVAHELTTAEFGVYGVVAAILNVMNTVMGVGTGQTISRLVAQNQEAAWQVLRWGIRWSWLMTAISAVAMALGAPLLAALLDDPSLARLLMIVMLVPGLYTIIASYTGFLNGMRALSRQAIVNMLLSLARLGLIGGATWLGLGLPGALSGWAVAAVVAAAAARALTQTPAQGGSIDLSVSVFARMMIGFVGVSLLLQLLLANDLLLVKRFVDGASADQQAGIYTAAQSMARIPYFLLIGVSQMVYPRLSVRGLGHRADVRETSSLILTGMFVMLAGTLALCLPLTEDLIQIVYPRRYAEGANTLGWLLAASALLSLAEASLTMLSGANGPRGSLLVLAGAVALQLFLGRIMVPRDGLTGAAQSTLLAALFALLLAATALWRIVGTTPCLRLLATSCVPLLALFASSSFWARCRMPPLSTLVFLALAYVGYLGCMCWMNSSLLRKLQGNWARLDIQRQ